MTDKLVKRRDKRTPNPPAKRASQRVDGSQADEGAVPTPAAIRRYCTDTLTHLAARLRAHTRTDGARVMALLTASRAEQPE